MKTIFLDRDGVINEIVMRGDLVSSPRSLDEFQILPEFVSFYERLQSHKFNVFVVSNQPDVSRRLLSQGTLDAMTEILERFNFKEIVYCTHDDSYGCQCRKPKPGMITGLLDKHRLDKTDALIIGDSKKDVLAGQAAGIKTVYLRRFYNQDPGCAPEFIIDTLSDALGIIMT